MRWLVYAYGNPPVTGICSGSRTFPAAAADLPHLGPARTDLELAAPRALWWAFVVAAMLLLVAAALWRWWRRDEAAVSVR